MLTAKKFLHENERMEWNLTNHTPNADQIMMIEDVRSWAKKFAKAVIASCPPSRELSLALSAIEQATTNAVAAIARAEVTV